MKLLPIIAAMMLATTAAADGLTDLGLDDPHVAPPVETSGSLNFYTGGGIGAATLNNTYDLTYRGKPEAVEHDLDGGAYSVFAGVRYTFDSGLFVGGEIQHTAIDAASTVDCHGVCQLCTAEQGGILDATLTAGYSTGRLTLYGLAGVAQTTGGYDVANPNGKSIGGGDYDTDGTVYGVGAEWVVSERWSVGVEYNAFDFGGASGDAKPYLVSSETDLETIQLRAIFTF